MSFAKWQSHYSSFDADALLGGLDRDYEDNSVSRYSALFVRLMNVACDAPAVPFHQRLALCTDAYAVANLLLTVENTGPAIQATLERLEKFGLYPNLASAFREGLFDQQNPLAQINPARNQN